MWILKESNYFYMILIILEYDFTFYKLIQKNFSLLLFIFKSTIQASN